MAVMVRNQFQDIFDALLPAIDVIYIQSRDLDETNAPWQQLYSMKKSKRQFENVTGVSGFGKFQTVGEGANIPLMSIAQLYDKKFTHTKWAGAWQVTEEMEDDDRFEVVSGMARAFARSFRFTKEVDFANDLNNSLTTVTSADGSAVGATHTLYNGSTIANNVATDFGVSSAQTMWNHYATLTDDQGLRIKLAPAYIAANPAMRWVISEVLKSELKPYVATNEVNALTEETLKPIYWAELTDTDAWYVSTKPSDLNGLGLRAYDRQPFTTSTDFKVENLTMISVGRGRWSHGCVDWRQLYISAGA